MGWRNCNASLRLVEAVNARWPQRSKASDGTIGDAAHAARPSSDHNPHVVVNGTGVVRARDITRAGVDLPWLFEQLRIMGQRGDPRLAGGGYLILDRRITTPDFRGWKAYKGANPHVKHGHVSFSRNQAGFDSNAPWNFGQPAGPAPVSGGRPTLQKGATGPLVGSLIAWANRTFPAYPTTPIPILTPPLFGPGTDGFVREFQRRSGLTADGVVGPKTWAAMERNGFR